MPDYKTVRENWIAHLLETGREHCWLCQSRRNLQIEHIMHGRARSAGKALLELCSYFRICAECHLDISKVLYEQYGVERGDNQQQLATMLAIKRHCDPQHFDRSRLLRLYGYADSYVDEND